MGTGNLPRICDTVHSATATSSRAPSLLTAAEKRRASGILPLSPNLQPCTGLRPGLNPAAPKPRVSPTRVSTPAGNYFNGTTAAPGALALISTSHRITCAPGLDRPRHIDSSRERRPPHHSYTPRSPGPDHTAPFGLRCGKAGAGTPSPSIALDSAFPRMNGGHSGLFPIAEDSASLAPPDVDTGQKPPSAGTQVPPVRDSFLNSSELSAGSPSSLRAHEHPLRTSTAPVEQVIPTLPVEPVVTPQPSVNATGVSARRRVDDPLFSPSRTGSEPPAPVDPQLMGAERATSGDVSPTRDNAPPPVTVRPAPRSASATQCPHRAALRASVIPLQGLAPLEF